MDPLIIISLIYDGICVSAESLAVFFVTQSQKKTINIAVTFVMIIANPIVGLVLAIALVPALSPKE